MQKPYIPEEHKVVPMKGDGQPSHTLCVSIAEIVMASVRPNSSRNIRKSKDTIIFVTKVATCPFLATNWCLEITVK